MLEHSRNARKQCWSTAGMRTGEMLEYTQKLLEHSRGVRRQVLEYSRDVHIDKYWNIVLQRSWNARKQCWNAVGMRTDPCRVPALCACIPAVQHPAVQHPAVQHPAVQQSRALRKQGFLASRSNGNARRKCWNTVKMYAKNTKHHRRVCTFTRRKY